MKKTRNAWRRRRGSRLPEWAALAAQGLLQFGHGPSMPVSPPSPGRITEPVLRDGSVQSSHGARIALSSVPLGVP